MYGIQNARVFCPSSHCPILKANTAKTTFPSCYFAKLPSPIHLVDCLNEFQSCPQIFKVLGSPSTECFLLVCPHKIKLPLFFLVYSTGCLLLLHPLFPSLSLSHFLYIYIYYLLFIIIISFFYFFFTLDWSLNLERSPFKIQTMP